jgi:hypothetical protein
MFVTVHLELPPHSSHTTTIPHMDVAVKFQNNVIYLLVITSTGRLLVLHGEKKCNINFATFLIETIILRISLVGTNNSE